MRSILVIDRRHLFPALSPQGFLPADAIDLEPLTPHLFFAERQYMETCSHYKQIIPYLVLTRGQGDDRRILAYQRRSKHTEARLGGRWSVGFGGHIEPLDRDAANSGERNLIDLAARRELAEETGLPADTVPLTLVGYINSDAEEVSSVHFGVVFTVALDGLEATDAALLEAVSAQAEPHRALWLAVADLRGQLGPGQAPDGGSFEDWSRIAVAGGIAGA
jgi:predicted NUDIX family phosphoesterase